MDSIEAMDDERKRACADSSAISFEMLSERRRMNCWCDSASSGSMERRAARSSAIDICARGERVEGEGLR
eukprot:1686163-Prymnesium_polylepis.1